MAFWFGQKRTEYIYTRGCIRLNLYSQAKLDAGHPELVKRDIDTMIRAYYRDMHLIPAWIPFFGPDREPDSTEEIAKRAAELKTVLDRTNSAPTDLAEVVRFVRTYMGTHSSYAAPQSLSDFIKNETQKKTSQ